MLYHIHTHEKKCEKYWDINVRTLKRKWKCDDPYQKFVELLEDSIKIRLRADVKIGASLSGGLDSSTIVGITSKKYHTKINTFSSIVPSTFSEMNGSI